ncbi:MAG TPA: sulfotransferase [Hypericibacter adhaerens]|jgi:hypothetical protein|uniref:sulfotransferase n=1 Tax=Hypericibacter adhaerens TaxID=2602016 RepID=UPI002C8ACBF0|nr:sulfotransferase [Hypericibacter adhaerens]HWA43529.1 sulfotransferase [Hypericibacter adhaerens]
MTELQDTAGAPAGMAVAIMGLMRTGSTLVTDMLSQRGRSLILSEPNILGMWSPNTVERIHQLALNNGLDPGAELPSPERWPRYQNYFETVLLPQLARLPLWGVKYVDLIDWRETFERYPPRRLILTVRDLRDVVISAIDRIGHLRLAFYGRRHMRDEAWVLANIAYNVHELMALRQRPHLLARYEDVVVDEGLRQRIVEYAGLESAAGTRENLAAGGFSRQWELNKHGGAVSTRSVGRYASEPPGPVKALAERAWRLLPEYSEAFGFEMPPPESWIRGHAFQRRPGDEANPIDYPKSESALWAGPTEIEPSFQLRHARLALAGRLPEGAVAIDFACGTPALSVMLPKGRRHIPVDMAPRGQGYRVAPLHEGKFPKVPGGTLLLALHVLEFLDADLPRLLRRLRLYDLPVIATYHAADDTEGIDRVALGWVNHLSRKALVAACRQAGFSVKARWRADGPQSFLHLEPVSLGEAQAPGPPPSAQAD